MKPILGITMGDAAGIGPELILKAFKNEYLFEICNPIVIGSLNVMNYYNRFFNANIVFNKIDKVSQAEYKPNVLDVLDIGILTEDMFTIGQVTAVCGEAAVIYTQQAGDLAVEGAVDAIVSAPLNKESMRAAGYQFEGQTQLLGELTNSKRYGMILLFGGVRVMMLTTHCSLREACGAVTKEKVLSMIELSHETLQGFGIEEPKIAVAGLNPHSGEGGLFGSEEVHGSIPAIESAVAKGINAIGPIPADIVFVKAKQDEYDLVLAMYHDQANMAAKLLGFGEVVTVLAGLPIIRTSVGHGTAFDIAGKNIANEKNFIKAIEAAVKIVLMKKGN